MAQPQLIEQPSTRKRSRPPLKGNISVSKSSPRVDTYTLVSTLQKKEEKRELLYGYIALFMKFGLLAIFSASFVNLGIASQQRVRRQVELSSVLGKEAEKLERLKRRFDQLFTIGGQHRFMKEQDQWITPNSVRVIWR